jgi:hypothetical protein
MKGVSPITIGLVLLAIPILVWLWWTADEGEAPVAAVTRPDAAAAGGAETRPSTEQVVQPRELPPIETFSAMIDHPLFAATRRPPGTEWTEEVPPPVEDTTLPPPPEDNIADRYRLIGTVDEAGRITALLAGTNGSFVRVRRGDRLESWTVSAINRQRVLMVRGESATELALEPERTP